MFNSIVFCNFHLSVKSLILCLTDMTSTKMKNQLILCNINIGDKYKKKNKKTGLQEKLTSDPTHNLCSPSNPEVNPMTS